MSQVERITEHLKNKGSINPKQAMELYGVMRLAAVIHEIKKAGYVVVSEMTKAENRYGETVRYATYRLGAEDGSQVDKDKHKYL